MKKLILFAAVLMVSLLSINNVKAQVSLNVNIGQQPVWGPTGYDHVDYYYFPDIDAYYYVPTSQYIYSNGGRWVWVRSLPSQFRNFDLYKAYKVVVNEPKPYLRNNVYVAKYSKFKSYGGRQTIIRDSRDTKYYVVKGHPNYNVNKTIIVKKNRAVHNQRTIVSVNQKPRPTRNNEPVNHGRAENNRFERVREKDNGGH